MAENLDPSLTIAGDSDTFASGLCLDDDTLLGDSLSVGRLDLPEPPSSQNPAKWFNHGLAILKKGAWSHAIEVFDQCLSTEHTDQDMIARSYALKGYALAKHGRVEEAIVCYKSCLEINEESIEALSGLACSMADMNRLDKALKYSMKACAARPENGPLRYNLGNIYLRMNELEQAVAAYGASISLLVGLFPAWVNLAAAHAAMKEYDKALEALDYAVVLQPDSRRAHVNRGLVLARLKRWEEASAALAKSINIAPEYARGYIILSLVESCRGNDIQAISVLNTCIDRGLMLPKAYHNLGLIHSRLGNHEQALAAYMTAVQIRPEYAKAFRSMGIEHLKHQEHAEAREAFEKAIEYRPSLASAWVGLADLARIDNDPEKCLGLLESAISHDPLDPEINSKLVMALVENGDQQKARHQFQILEQQAPRKANKIKSFVYPEEA
ncbi:MAG: hypothetical protein CMJ40_03450 [Phycisphaerae bacterium]|nr:hypothetical protein [Phycisphaerae bacterium]|tara:strand:+ start:1895 stop:3217 length:1323 start_codon:yes stop_codon:yes gene_type:complete